MEMKKIFVKPYIPQELKKLYALTLNLWSYWDKDCELLFKRIDINLYRECKHNANEFIQKVPTEKLEKLAADKGFLYELDKVARKFEKYIDFEGSFRNEQKERVPFKNDDLIAYLSMEYGMHESLPVYSGGLGVLSGDHLKAASDIGVPLVSFGLFYKYGYFKQKINIDGMQEEEYTETQWYAKSIEEVKDDKGNSVIIDVPVNDEIVNVKLWKTLVGKITLYLLDTNLNSNSPVMKSITDILYDSNRDKRILQEIILGRGSYIAMQALGLSPKVFHLNEGHSAFIIIERLKDLLNNRNYNLEAAINYIRHSTIFTTHTPVVEGNENFPKELILKYLKKDIEDIGFTESDFLALGKNAGSEMFWLPAFAIRFARFTNGVSEIHSQVSQKMWASIFPGRSTKDVPIDFVTNGIHVQTWLSTELTHVYDRYMGPEYHHRADSEESWKGIFSAPSNEVWAAHCRRKENLISFVRKHLADNLMSRGGTESKIRSAKAVLNPNYLTIGFARRFAPYKRATLILNNPERLVKILKNPDKPVQIIFAGKAHPADEAGKNLIKRILDFAKQHNVEDRIVFVEDYNMNVAKYLVQGVDVWLNNPLKPLEASGTSGMKSGINGVLNFSVMDGWWPECYNGKNGWSITAGEKYDNYEMRLNIESNQVYDLLEDEITELYYLRDENNVPQKWVSRMKQSIYTVGKAFNMHRVLRDYFYKFYNKEVNTLKEIMANDNKLLKDLGGFKKRIDKTWKDIYIRDFFPVSGNKTPSAGQTLEATAYVYLGDAEHEDYVVEMVYCPGDDCPTPYHIKMEYIKTYDDKVAEYRAKFTLEGAGIQSFGMKIYPAWDLFLETYPNYIKTK